MLLPCVTRAGSAAGSSIHLSVCMMQGHKRSIGEGGAKNVQWKRESSLLFQHIVLDCRLLASSVYPRLPTCKHARTHTCRFTRLEHISLQLSLQYEGYCVLGNNLICQVPSLAHQSILSSSYNYIYSRRSQTSRSVITDGDLESELRRGQVKHCGFMHQSKMIPVGSACEGQ